MEIINLELSLSDLERVEKRIQRAAKDKTVSQAEKDGLQKVCMCIYTHTHIFYRGVCMCVCVCVCV
jgi:ribosome-binding ATPase YchF (GTP1/OBG family)